MTFSGRISLHVQTVIRPLVDEIATDPEIALRFVIADTPERHFLKGLQHHSGRFSCETCTAVASTGGAVHWPYETCYGKPERTAAELRHAARYEQNTFPGG